MHITCKDTKVGMWITIQIVCSQSHAIFFCKYLMYSGWSKLSLKSTTDVKMHYGYKLSWTLTKQNRWFLSLLEAWHKITFHELTSHMNINICFAFPIWTYAHMYIKREGFINHTKVKENPRMHCEAGARAQQSDSERGESLFPFLLI